jgi:perosamine synthetase
MVCGFKKGDEVIVPDISWMATASVISLTGATPVFVDVESTTWCIDPEAIEKAITKRTKGIMIVHCYGTPCKMDEIMAIAKKHNLKVIEDAAPSLGSLYKGKKVGGIGDIGCISFHGAKIAVGGEGGMFLTNNKEYYDKAVYLSNQCRTDRKGTFWCDDTGYEYQMANVTAALILAQVERIEELVTMKRTIYSWYEKYLDIPTVTLLKENKGDRSNYCYPAIIGTKKNGKVVELLKKYNIHARVAFPRMSLFPMHKQRFYNPISDSVMSAGLNLPSALNITEKDVKFVCKKLKEIYEKS